MTDTGATAHPTRRVELTLRRPWFALYAGIRPTLVIAGRGQPTQWGVGTWQLPDDEDAALGVFLFSRGWRFGDAEAAIPAGDRRTWEYRAPALPFGRGRLRPTGEAPEREERR
ncbi:hypothetical protein A8L33_01885 [Microbacterium aurantiacum]|uniref:Uncharacterized protein n=2 Tax=Microbacterium aurantiacum TaxID=162393 RepID=A0A0M8MKB3_9MICO|nr:hypothetical protein A8L33_01885 [Microbacterium chocolatum]KOS11857.1 hypothetical protein XI38_04320 [Microbacterium chocolatum]